MTKKTSTLIFHKKLISTFFLLLAYCNSATAEDLHYTDDNSHYTNDYTTLASGINSPLNTYPTEESISESLNRAENIEVIEEQITGGLEQTNSMYQEAFYRTISTSRKATSTSKEDACFSASRAAHEEYVRQAERWINECYSWPINQLLNQERRINVSIHERDPAVFYDTGVPTWGERDLRFYFNRRGSYDYLFYEPNVDIDGDEMVIDGDISKVALGGFEINDCNLACEPLIPASEYSGTYTIWECSAFINASATCSLRNISGKSTKSLTW